MAQRRRWERDRVSATIRAVGNSARCCFTSSEPRVPAPTMSRSRSPEAHIFAGPAIPVRFAPKYPKIPPRKAEAAGSDTRRRRRRGARRIPVEPTGLFRPLQMAPSAFFWSIVFFSTKPPKPPSWDWIVMNVQVAPLQRPSGLLALSTTLLLLVALYAPLAHAMDVSVPPESPPRM